MDASVSSAGGLGTDRAPQCGLHGTPAQRSRSMRSQVLGTVLVINLVAALGAGLGILWNARMRTDREMTASVELAERFARDFVERLNLGVPGTRIESWPVEGRDQRHVHIRVEHGDGHTTNVVTPKSIDEGATPKWFAALVGARQIEREIPIVVRGKPSGRVVITGTPSDEVSEVWENVRGFLLIAVGVNLAILLALYFALGRVVGQLRGVAMGLGELEQGRFGHRMAPPAIREFAALTERFNALAGALDTARRDNARLNRELVSTQDDERRQIAADLHDELGPCLFGLKANVGSLERLSSETTIPAAAKMKERISTIVEIIERLQTLNRRLLQKLRPVAIDHVPIADVLANLVAEFERHAPERQFAIRLGRLEPHYGNSIDVTLYRCVQEGVTNALKHGDAQFVRIELDEFASASGRRLGLCIADDGHGLPAKPSLGLGLIGMSERVRALGGSCHVAAAADKGTCVAVEIPITAETSDIHDPRRDKKGSS
jgi:two-component system sensor histidine kinase UhpB